MKGFNMVGVGYSLPRLTASSGRIAEGYISAIYFFTYGALFYG
jgi:hypothetical protein